MSLSVSGANANAVKELVVVGMILGSRDIFGGINYVQTLDQVERQSLVDVQRQTISGGLLALILGVGMAFIFKENIAGPVRRDRKSVV